MAEMGIFLRDYEEVCMAVRGIFRRDYEEVCMVEMGKMVQQVVILLVPHKGRDNGWNIQFLELKRRDNWWTFASIRLM